MYEDALAGIFERMNAERLPCMFMTPNMMCTRVSGLLVEKWLRDTAAAVSELQNDGTMDLYMDAARRTAAAYRIPVCDCYAREKAGGGRYRHDQSALQFYQPSNAGDARPVCHVPAAKYFL